MNQYVVTATMAKIGEEVEKLSNFKFPLFEKNQDM